MYVKVVFNFHTLKLTGLISGTLIYETSIVYDKTFF